MGDKRSHFTGGGCPKPHPQIKDQQSRDQPVSCLQPRPTHGWLANDAARTHGQGRTDTQTAKAPVLRGAPQARMLLPSPSDGL